MRGIYFALDAPKSGHADNSLKQDDTRKDWYYYSIVHGVPL
jgi:hypothetical protein